MKIYKDTYSIALADNIALNTVHQRLRSGKYLKVLKDGKKIGYMSVKENKIELGELVGK